MGQCLPPRFTALLRGCPLPLLGRKRCVHPRSLGPQGGGRFQVLVISLEPCVSRMGMWAGAVRPLSEEALCATAPSRTPEPFHDILRREPCHSGRWALRIQTTPHVFIGTETLTHSAFIGQTPGSPRARRRWRGFWGEQGGRPGSLRTRGPVGRQTDRNPTANR